MKSGEPTLTQCLVFISYNTHIYGLVFSFLVSSPLHHNTHLCSLEAQDSLKMLNLLAIPFCMYTGIEQVPVLSSAVQAVIELL